MAISSIKNLHLTGTSHISKHSINEVKNFIQKEKPNIIALELDSSRYTSLTSGGKRKLSLRDIKEVGFKGYLFNLIGSLVQKRLGKLVGIDPGSEMIAAIKLAKENSIELSLIDQDIRITLKRLSKLITFKEKLRLFTDFIKSPFIKKIDGIDLRSLDLSSVPEDGLIKLILQLLKKRYPSFYKVLIEERNDVLAKNLNTMMSSNPDKKILAIMGAGHVPGVIKLLSIKNKE